VRTALLDLDGTLVDSAAMIVSHLAAALDTVGIPDPGPVVLRSFVGPPFETALPAIGLTPEQTAAVITVYRATYDPVAATETPIYPGVVAMLDRLKSAGVRLALATSKPEHLALRIVDGVGIAQYLTVVGGSDDTVGRVGKDKVVASVLDRLGLDPAAEPVVMVGDRHHDVDGAAVHGVPTIGVEWGYAEAGELAGAAAVVPDVAALEKALLSGDVWSTAAPAA